jgi:hypothetical protein
VLSLAVWLTLAIQACPYAILDARSTLAENQTKLLEKRKATDAVADSKRQKLEQLLRAEKDLSPSDKADMPASGCAHRRRAGGGSGGGGRGV